MNPKKVQNLRRLAFEKQGCLCYYCQFPMWEKDPAEFAMGFELPIRLAKYLQCTAEHLVAQQDEGTDTADNIVAACLWCNRLRHLGRSQKAPGPLAYKAKVAQLVRQGKWHPIASSKVAKKLKSDPVRSAVSCP